MIVLGIDTSGATSSAAVRAGRGTAVAVSERPRAHAAVLPELIEQACAEAGVVVADIGAVAVARGPGLFTGLRVGLVTAQLIGLARGAPVAGVSTLAAAASRVAAQHRPTRPFCVMLDARRREVFAQTFAPDLRPLGEPVVLPAAAARCDHPVHRDAGAAALGVPGDDLETAGLAAEVAAIAAARWEAGEPVEPATALYLRRPDTTAANPARSVLGPR